jgi:hypothetical protein
VQIISGRLAKPSTAESCDARRSDSEIINWIDEQDAMNPRYIVAAAAVCVIVLLWLARDVAAVKTQLRDLQSHRLVEMYDDPDPADPAADDDQIVAAPPPAPPPPAAPAAPQGGEEDAFEG